MDEQQSANTLVGLGETPAPVGTGSDPQARRPMLVVYLCGTVSTVLLLGWGLNYLLVGQPVAHKLDADPRNSGYSLSAHYRYYLDPTTLVLDLRDVESAAPVDLFRAVFQSADALHAAGRRFDRVILARSGKPVFIIQGKEFSSLGEEFAAGQNPVYLIRTLPEKLYRPSGEAAFGRWSGGWLGVLGKQMGDATEAAGQWGQGH